jgi:hypothetical protein
VFVAHGKAKGTFTGVGAGVVIESHSDDDEGEVKSLLLKEDGLTRGADGAPPAGAHDAESGAQTSSERDGDVNVNVNPVLNEGGMAECENVHVMNVLDSAPASTRTLEQLALADNNWLDGIPGGMFDWGASLELVIRWMIRRPDKFTGRWDEFFSRLNPPGNTQALAAAVLSTGLPQPSATVVVTQGGEGVAAEQRCESTENCSLPVPTSS